MIDAAELATLRALWASALDTTATVAHRTTASDGQGGETTTETVAGPYAARLQPAGPGAIQTAGGLLVEHDTWLVALPYDAAVGTGDRIVSGGETFEVRSVDVGRSNNYGVQARCTRQGA